MAKTTENGGMDPDRRRKSRKSIADKKREIESRELSKKLFVGDFAKFLETESKETGRTPQELVDEIINSSLAIVQFSESTGKASLIAPTSWGNVAEKNPNNEDLLNGYREMRENFAPVSAGIEWHKGFTIGGGFTIQIEDSKDSHQKSMKQLIETFVRQVYQDQLTKGLFAILDIMMDIAATDGCVGAEIVYGVETKFEDYITGYEDVEMPDTEKVGKTKIVKVPIFKEPIWQSVKEIQGGKEVIVTQGLDGISRLKIIDNSVMRLTPYRHPKSGEILFWTVDEKVKNQNVLYYATQETVNANPTKLLPWEVFWLTWSRHSTNLKGVSQIKPIYSVAKFVQDITKAIGIGLNRWANKKYFFVTGTDKRPWGKPHQDQFLKAMEQMIKNNWIGIPTPAGFDIKEIGGENSIFDGSNLLSYLTGMICFAPKTPILANPEFKNIEELTIGDKVLTHDGTFQPIVKTMNRQFEGDLIVLQPHYSPAIKVTPNHPILIATEKTIEYGQFGSWIKAEDVKESDYVVFPRPKLNTMNNPFNFELTDDFMELLGYYIGDGHISKDSWIYISLNNDEREKLVRLTEIVTKIFEEPHMSIHRRPKTNVILFGIRNESLAKQFKEFCNFPSYNKQIPDSIMGISQEQFNSLWKGLLASDGHVRPKGQEFFVSASRKLIGQIYLLMAKLGVVPYVRRIEPQPTKFSKSKGGKEVWSRESWQIITYYPKKQEWTKVFDDRIYIPIMKINKERYDGTVYNFAVANNETYTTFGCLVHNCSGMNYPREFLEAGKTQASDKAWLAWTVTYGHTQVQIKHAIESQLFERHIWCTIGKEYTVPKKGVSEGNREKFPVYVPRVEWKAEGQWLRNDKMKTLKSILDAANPADAPLKLSIEKEMATTMGLGEVDFSVVEDLLNTETKNRLAVSKQNNLLNEAKLEVLEKMKKEGKLTDEIMTKLLAPPTEQKPPATQPDQQTLEKRGEKRLEGGVDRTNRDKEGKKGQSKEMGGTRLPYHETDSTIIMEMPSELATAMVETEKLKQEQLKKSIEKSELIKKLKERLEERKTVKKVNENE